MLLVPYRNHIAFSIVCVCMCMCMSMYEYVYTPEYDKKIGINVITVVGTLWNAKTKLLNHKILL